jgi:crotonobetainyl-CoA:carnitine CoA-transferase CaiB-like acyl-CoA transferase
MPLALRSPQAFSCSQRVRRTKWLSSLLFSTRRATFADVVVENFRPDVKAKLGIDYDSLRKINPRIVYGSISGFGQDGPYHKRPGFDQIAQGMAG